MAAAVVFTSPFGPRSVAVAPSLSPSSSPSSPPALPTHAPPLRRSSSSDRILHLLHHHAMLASPSSSRAASAAAPVTLTGAAAAPGGAHPATSSSPRPSTATIKRKGSVLDVSLRHASRLHSTASLWSPISPGASGLLIGGECGIAQAPLVAQAATEQLAAHLDAVLAHSARLAARSSSPTAQQQQHHHHHHHHPHTTLSPVRSAAEADAVRPRASVSSLGSSSTSGSESSSVVTEGEDELDEEGADQYAFSGAEAESDATSVADGIEDSQDGLPSNTVVAVNSTRTEMTLGELIQHLATWSFDANAFSSSLLPLALRVLLLAYLARHPTLVEAHAQLGVSDVESRVEQMCNALEAGYRVSNAYHNFRHAVDVVQGVYMFLQAEGLAIPLTDLKTVPSTAWPVSQVDAKLDGHLFESIKTATMTMNPVPLRVEESMLGRIGKTLGVWGGWGVLLAAAGHDVGHPGLSNAFMINARTPLARVYSDRSVLEQFHTTTFLRILRGHGFGPLLGTWSTDGSTTAYVNVTGQVVSAPAPTTELRCTTTTVTKAFRDVIVGAILATDMGRHFEIVKKLEDMASVWGNDKEDVGFLGSWKSNEEDERVLCAAGFIKCGDISNPTRPHHISVTWSSCLLDEWAKQASLETALELPVSVVTLDPAQKKAQANSQIGFTKMFVEPLFDSMEKLTRGFAPFAESCRAGKAVWQKVSEAIDLAAAQPAVESPPVTATPIADSTTPVASVSTPTPPACQSNTTRTIDLTPPRSMSSALAQRRWQKRYDSQSSVSSANSARIDEEDDEENDEDDEDEEGGEVDEMGRGLNETPRPVQFGRWRTTSSSSSSTTSSSSPPSSTLNSRRATMKASSNSLLTPSSSGVIGMKITVPHRHSIFNGTTNSSPSASSSSSGSSHSTTTHSMSTLTSHGSDSPVSPISPCTKSTLTRSGSVSVVQSTTRSKLVGVGNRVLPILETCIADDDEESKSVDQAVEVEVEDSVLKLKQKKQKEKEDGFKRARGFEQDRNVTTSIDSLTSSSSSSTVTCSISTSPLPRGESVEVTKSVPTTTTMEVKCQECEEMEEEVEYLVGSSSSTLSSTTLPCSSCSSSGPGDLVQWLPVPFRPT